MNEKGARAAEVQVTGEVSNPGTGWSGPRYSDYDGFAGIYDRHWGRPSAETNLSLLKEMLLPRLPASARVLDLCCGSGQLAGALVECGYRVTGVDGSEELLALARQNAPGAQFITADARSFALIDRYDAAISVSDGLNHMLSLAELSSVFQHTCSVLQEGGLLFFDLNREFKYRTTWSGDFSIVDDECVCRVRARYSPDTKVARCDATILEASGERVRSEMSLFQTWYSDNEVCSALQTAGFGTVDLSYSNPGDAENSDKAFYLCRKGG
jgi:SAM-dependent methyltransferase